MTPYLNKPLRSFDQAMAEREDRQHRTALGEMLQWMEQARLQYMNSPGPATFLSTYDNRISALEYALEEMNKAAAKRVLAQSEDR